MAADSRTTSTSLIAVLWLGLLVVAAPADAARLATPKQVAPAEGVSVAELPAFS
jgi:hypothetical protein